MVIAIISIILPLLIGLIITICLPARNDCKALLLHHIYSTQSIPRSLSEISIEKLQQLCEIAREEQSPLCSLRDAPKNNKCTPLTFDDGFVSVYEKALPILQKYSFSATIYVTTAHLSNQKSKDVYGHPKMSDKMIKHLHLQGFEIGSHTVTHRALTLLSDELIREELNTSKQTLEKIIKAPVSTLAFPLGLWNERVLSIAKECGYTSFSIYNYHNRAQNRPEITPVTAIYPFDSQKDMKNKVRGGTKRAQGLLRARIIPHFAKGSPLASFSKAYSPLRFFDRFNSL